MGSVFGVVGFVTACHSTRLCCRLSGWSSVDVEFGVDVKFCCLEVCERLDILSEGVGPETSMRAFKTTLYLLALIPLFTGALNVVLGLQAQGLIGAQLSPEGFRDPLLNSQMRFYGAIWFGFGLLLCVCLSNIKIYSSLLRGSLAIVFLGGVGRIASLVQFGFPTEALSMAFVIAVTAIEIIGMPLLLWWHSHLSDKS